MSPRRAQSGPVRLRLPVAVVLLSAAAFTVLGALGVREIGALTRTKVHGAVADLVALRAQEIAAFLRERARIVPAVLSEPALMEWWRGYTTYRRPLADDAEWHRIQAYLAGLQASDPTILSVFFATESTGEYFQSNGRVEREGYEPKQRWWWSEAIARQRLYVTAPAVDAGTGDLLVTVQTAVFTPEGLLLGVAGVDVLVATLGELVNGITYQGEGMAFLVDEGGRVVYFPAMDFGALPRGARVTTELAAVDDLFPDTDGFAALTGRLRAGAPGLARVRWRGERLFVLFTPVESSEPELHWRLGLAVPEAVITAPIDRVRRRAALAILVAMAAIALVTLTLTRRVDAQLRAVDRERVRSLAEANARLLEADEIKRRFLASMSHELRTPLNSIIGFSTILRAKLAGRVDERFLGFLDNIRSSGDHLLATIADILDLAKVEAGRIELCSETIRVPELVGGACDLVQALARARDLRLEVALDPDLPEVVADPVRLRQVLLNLLSNAIKFAYPGTAVRITATVVAPPTSPLGRHALAIAVADSGIGIAPEEQAAVFEEFRQARRSNGALQGGTGLGLALVKRLVELHGGCVLLDSALGLGSTFTVYLPLGPGGAGVDAGDRVAPAIA